MTWKTADGRGIIETVTVTTLNPGTLAVIAAPPAGFRVRVLTWAGVQNGGTMQLIETTSLTVRASQTAGTLGRAFIQTHADGVAIFADGEGVSALNNSANAEDITLTFVVEPTT